MNAGLVLKAPLFLQGSSTALHPTTPARFTVPGHEQPPDPTLLCFYSMPHGDTFILLFWAHQVVIEMTFRTNRLTPLQERAEDSLCAGCWWIRHSVSRRQLRVQRGTASHHPHRPHTQLLPFGNLHEDLLHERHWWVLVFRTSWQFQLHWCKILLTVSLLSVRPGALPNLQKNDANMFSWSYPDSWEKPCSFYGLNFQVKVVRHTNSCDSEAPILVSEARTRNIPVSSLSRRHFTWPLFTQVNNTDNTKFEVNVKTKKYVFCVRAQDRYTGGPFGPWSDCT